MALAGKTQGSSVDIESSGWESNSCRSIAGYSSDSGLQDSDVALVDLFSQNIDNLFEKRCEASTRMRRWLPVHYFTSSNHAMHTSETRMFVTPASSCIVLRACRRETRERALAALQGFYRQDVRAEEAMQK